MRHRDVVSLYSDPDNVSFLDSDIETIYVETPLNEIFNIDSLKTPDLTYLLLNGDVVIGEVKGTFSINNIGNARTQLYRYKRVLSKNIIPNTGFIALGSEYLEYEGEVIFIC